MNVKKSHIICQRCVITQLDRLNFSAGKDLKSEVVFVKVIFVWRHKFTFYLFLFLNTE